MSLGLQLASIGGVAKTLVVAQDPNGNIAAAHVTVNSSGVEVGVGVNPFTVTVANLPATQAVSITALPLPAGAATAARQPALGLAGAPSADVLTVQGNVAGAPLPVSGTITDSNSAPFMGVVPITPGTPVLPQRSIGFICTASGNVTLTLADASTLTLPISIGGGAFQLLPFAVTNVTLATGTTGLFWGLK